MGVTSVVGTSVLDIVVGAPVGDKDGVDVGVSVIGTSVGIVVGAPVGDNDGVDVVGALDGADKLGANEERAVVGRCVDGAAVVGRAVVGRRVDGAAVVDAEEGLAVVGAFE